METRDLLRRALTYNHWANRLTLSSLKSQPQNSWRALRALAHLLIAEREWLLRLEENRDTTGFDFWPQLSLENCETMMEQTHEAYEKLLDGLTEDDLDKVASYKNSKGVAYRTPYRDILQHVLHHSNYHRGQIAAAVRAGGGTPAYTDYIAFERGNQSSSTG
jgi:uncharacterized damage-inducible protein DinB